MSDEPDVVDEVPVTPRDDGRKQQFFGGVVLVLWSDGTVTSSDGSGMRVPRWSSASKASSQAAPKWMLW